MSVQHLSHVGLCVSDLDASRRFYCDRLGFREVHALDVSGEEADRLLELSDVDLQAVYLERDGVRIELLHYREPGHRGEGIVRPMNALGLTHLSFRVDDLDATVRALREAGVRVLEQTRIDAGHGVAAVFVTDPDGTRVELVQGPRDPTGLPGP
jgi:catechol 2,3-dioxygenase-like lactoylglutathione lyase family enzyme